MADSKQGTKLGPVLSPMTEDFHPGTSHEPAEGVITNGVPGYPKGSDGIINRVTFFQGGNFGKVKHDQGKE